MSKGYVKVPIIMQMEALECGAASLAMILAYHGKWLPLEKVRLDCGVSRDGSNAKNIILAARSYGLTAAGYRFEIEDLHNIKFPCIIHWNFNHFVVLCGFKKNSALLNDPARGIVEVSMKEFDESFTGICIQFNPTEHFVPEGKPRSMIAFAQKRLKGTLVPILFVMITGMLAAIIGVINPVFSRVFMDRILSGESPDWLFSLLLSMSGVLIIHIIVSLISTFYMLKIQGKFAIVANATFMWHVLRLPMEFFAQRMAGDIATRQNSNEGIAAFLMNQLAPVLLNLIMLIFYLTVMLKYSLLLSAVGIITVLLNSIVAQIISNKRINITRVQMRDAGKLAGTTVAGIEMIETIKASGAENGFFERWAGYQASVNTSSVNFAKLNQYLGAVPTFLLSLANVIVLLLGAMLIMKGAFTAGMLLAFQGFMLSFMTPVNSIITAGQSIQEMRTSMERVEDVMNYETDVTYTDIDPNTDTEYAKLSGDIVLKNVTFGYSRLAEPLIKDFNLTLKQGSRVAFVGFSGCGKSTLSKLISGLYKPWSGEILFDGKPINAITREVFTGSVAVVDQDVILFEDTIANNLKMWDSSIEDFEMILAARDAHIHDIVMERDGSYNSKILEGGKNFSGGQRQRFEIARVLAQDPTIVILDEATSALDAKTEFEVVKSIKDRGITCIIVAHRLSTIRDCDEIIVMDNGIVVERGKHSDLFSEGGLYAKLVSNE
ncbi:NHLP family bacteriocin export ABC transporter peptidase/permease/ATPase subunit [Oscillospiraceae bacterium LTW-04]|nr:NHLP family bacteriocin export ABC transporter peptidase/permease/ATPase subunit [Oscillospiraceae bacterium MB24-C1]